MNPMAMRVAEMGASEGCPVTGQIEVASPGWDEITSPETELTSCWCSTRERLRNRCMKQANDDGATRWCGFTHSGRNSLRRANRQQVSIE